MSEQPPSGLRASVGQDALARSTSPDVSVADDVDRRRAAAPSPPRLGERPPPLLPLPGRPPRRRAAGRPSRRSGAGSITVRPVAPAPVVEHGQSSRSAAGGPASASMRADDGFPSRSSRSGGRTAKVTECHKCIRGTGSGGRSAPQVPCGADRDLGRPCSSFTASGDRGDESTRGDTWLSPRKPSRS